MLKVRTSRWPVIFTHSPHLVHSPASSDHLQPYITAWPAPTGVFLSAGCDRKCHGEADLLRMETMRHSGMAQAAIQQEQLAAHVITFDYDNTFCHGSATE